MRGRRRGRNIIFFAVGLFLSLLNSRKLFEIENFPNFVPIKFVDIQCGTTPYITTKCICEYIKKESKIWSRNGHFVSFIMSCIFLNNDSSSLDFEYINSSIINTQPAVEKFIMYGQMSKQISNNSYFMHIVGIFEWFRSLELRRITHKKIDFKEQDGEWGGGWGKERKKWPSYVNTNFILSNFHNFEIFSCLLVSLVETHFIHQIFMLLSWRIFNTINRGESNMSEGWNNNTQKISPSLSKDIFYAVKVFYENFIEFFILFSFCPQAVTEQNKFKKFKWHFCLRKQFSYFLLIWQCGSNLFTWF